MRGKVILMFSILLAVVLFLFFFPKDSGLVERSPNGRKTVGDRYKCLGFEISFKTDNRAEFKCFGFTYSKATF